MQPSAWFVSLVAALVLSTSVHAKGKPNPLSGKRLYRSYCLVCHGADGKTRGPLAEKLNLAPADLSSARYQTKEVAELAELIGGYDRRKGSRMLRWGEALEERDLYDLAAYLSMLGRKDLRYLGDTRKGRAIFQSACVACHGRFGRGNGILARLINARMIDFTDRESIENIGDEEFVRTIREGKGAFMPSWQGVFGDHELADLGAYVHTLPAMAKPWGENRAKPDPVAGKWLYRAYCLVCHGADGKGVGPLAGKLGSPPADLSSERYQSKRVDELADLIEGYGREAGLIMPSWGVELPRKDLRDIAAYITEPTRPGLDRRGDKRRGRAIFKETCIACHGRSGSGDGVLAQLIGIPMIAFTEAQKMTKFSDAELLSTIREGKGAFMPSWKAHLAESEIVDVGAYVRTLER